MCLTLFPLPLPCIQRAASQSPESLWCQATPVSVALCQLPASQKKRKRCPSLKLLIMKASAPWMILASLSLSARWVELIGFCSRLDQLGTVMLHRSVFWPISLVLICDHSHKRGLLSAVSNFWLHIKSLFLPPVSHSISVTLPLWVSYKDELRKGLCFWTARPSLLLYVISVKAFRVSTTQLSISWRAAFRGRHVKLQDEWARESKRKNERRPIKAKRKGEKKKKTAKKKNRCSLLWADKHFCGHFIW